MKIWSDHSNVREDSFTHAHCCPLIPGQPCEKKRGCNISFKESNLIHVHTLTLTDGPVCRRHLGFSVLHWASRRGVWGNFYVLLSLPPSVHKHLAIADYQLTAGWGEVRRERGRLSALPTGSTFSPILTRPPSQASHSPLPWPEEEMSHYSRPTEHNPHPKRRTEEKRAVRAPGNHSSFLSPPPLPSPVPSRLQGYSQASH